MSACLRIRVAVAAALLFASAASAQQRRPITGEGTEGFRALLASRHLKPIEDPEQAREDPAHTLIISFRGAKPSFGGPFGTAYPDQIGNIGFDIKRSFVDQGGALFFASDQAMGLGSSGWNRSFGFQISGAILYSAEADSESCYRDNPQCPFVRGVTGSVPDLFQPNKVASPQLFGEPADTLRRVASNRPSYLLPSNELETLARFPQICNMEITRGPNRFEVLAPRRVQFAQERRYDGGGRFLVLSDHSVFINSMLLPSSRFPNDNLAFAANCLDWLMTGPSGETRTKVLFMEDGKIWKKDDYNLMLQTLPSPNPEDMLGFLWENRDLLWQNHEMAEQLLSSIEREKLFADLERGDGKDPNTTLGSVVNRMLTDTFGEFRIVRFVLIVGMAALLGYGIFSLIKSRFSYSRKVPRFSLALDRVKPRAGLLEMRLRGGVGRGQYYEIARERAREMFAGLDLTPGEGGPPPRFTINAGWWKRASIERQLREVWQVAFGSQAVPVTSRRWQQWQSQLDEIRTMIRRGVIRFEESQESA